MTAPWLAMLPLAAVIVAAVPAATAGRIGDLAYDQRHWQVERHGERYEVRLRKGLDDAGLTVRFAPGAPSACTAETMTHETEGLADRSFKTIAKPGADIYVVTAWFGCRNARPPTVHACAAYKGRIYRFDALVLSCEGGPGFSGGRCRSSMS